MGINFKSLSDGNGSTERLYQDVTVTFCQDNKALEYEEKLRYLIKEIQQN